MDNKERVIQEWWDTLEYLEQQEILSDVYPDEYIHDEDSMWGLLDLDRRYDIYLNWETGYQ